MRIKSYFAKTVDEGIAQARVDLGGEALLLNTKKVGGQAGLPAGYEVVFGMTEEPVAAIPVVQAVKQLRMAPARIEDGESPEPSGMTVRENFANGLDRLHEQMDEIRNMLVRSSSARIAIGRSVPELVDVHARLMANDVEPALAKDIIDRLEALMSTDAFFFKATESREPAANRWKSLKFDSKRLEAFVRAEMRGRVRIDAKLAASAMAVVGPTGAGKTTSLMKIASAEVGHRPVRILTLDTARASTLVQLQSFANRVGAMFASVPSMNALPEMVAPKSEKEIVMIDTPGFAGSGGQDAEAAAFAFAACGEIETHLVAPGYMKAADLRRSIERYAMFRPSKLIVTKLDETNTFGSVFSEIVRAGLALSYLTHGPGIPADIRAASVEDLVALAVDREPARAECA